MLTPPKTPITMAPTKLEHVTIDGQGLRGGYSRKPGNLILNWEKLLKLVPDLALSAAATTYACSRSILTSASARA